MAVRPQPKLTYEDLLNFPDDGLRRELIDGEVYVMASPDMRHQDVVLRLVFAIEAHLRSQGGGKVCVAPLDVLLSSMDVVQPDVIFVAHADAGVLTPQNIRGAPSLVVEVLSDPRRDRNVKRDLYARLGVPEYWIVDPEADRVEVFLPEGDAYAKPLILEPGDALATPLLPGLSIDVAELLAR